MAPRLSRALARAAAADFPAAVRALLPRVRPPRTLAGIYGFCADQDLSFGPPGPWLDARDLALLRRRLRGAPREGACLILAAGELLSGRPGRAARRLEGLGGGAAAFLRAASLWAEADRTRAVDLLPRAVDAAEEARAAFPRRPDALLLHAQILRECERNDESLAGLRAVLRLDPGDWRTRLGVAETLTDMYRYRPALRELAAVERVTGRRWWLLAQRARLKGFCGRPRAALADFDAAIALAPRVGSLHSWRAEVLRGQGRLGEAGAALDRAVLLDPAYAFSFELRGRLRLIAGDAAGAARDLDRACRLDPSHRLAFAWRGEALWKLGRAREAFADFERVAPLQVATLWNPGTGRMEPPQARAAALAADLDAQVSARPGDAWAILARGALALWSGKPREALDDLSAAAASAAAPAPRPKALSLRGEAWARLGETARAIADLDAALRMAPDDARARAGRARLLAAAGRAAEARADYDAALARPAPALAAAYAERGALRAAAGDGAGADADARAAIAYGAKTAGTRGH